MARADGNPHSGRPAGRVDRARRLPLGRPLGGITLILVAVIAVVVVLWTIWETIRWKYTITNRRVFVRHGLVSINEQTARLERVQDITLHQTPFDRIFGVGKLADRDAGSSGGPLEFPGAGRSRTRA